MFSFFGIYSITILFVFLLGASIALAIILGAQRRRVGQLKRSRLEIKQEEGRVFDFLHGLGSAFCEGVCPSKLHRLIVEGAVRILSATGGALYLVDRDENRLTPSFLTENTPPLVIIPDFMSHSSPTLLSHYGVKSQAPSSIKSFLQLNTILPGQGLLGEAWEWKEPRYLDRDYLPEKLVTQGLDSVLLGPLIYGGRTLGVLAVSNVKDNSFSPGGLELFRAIVDQSAFALYNQAVYKDAGEKRLIDHDLEIAGEVQKILLPSQAPTIAGYQISGVNIPARVLSGDYFDYLFIDEHLLGIAIADVSGKGIPASLIMALCRSALRSQATTDASPSSVLHKLNRQLYPDMREDMFISMAYIIINNKTDEVLLARAGHDAPLFYRAADHSIERLNPKGMAVGIDSGEVFDRFCSDFSFRFEQGDCLLLYTDGVTEALNTHGLEFGIERLIKCLKENANNSSEILLKRLTDEIRLFINHQPQHDDITLIAIRKL